MAWAYARTSSRVGRKAGSSQEKPGGRGMGEDMTRSGLGMKAPPFATEVTRGGGRFSSAGCRGNQFSRAGKIRLRAQIAMGDSPMTHGANVNLACGDERNGPPKPGNRRHGKSTAP